jgi:hypothetical protein
MLFAFAALLVHLGSFSAVPAAAASATSAAKAAPAPAPTPTTGDLPLAPLPSNSTASASAAPADGATPAGQTRTQREQSPLLRAAAIDASTAQSLSTIRVPEAQPLKQNFVDIENPVSRRKWMALTLLNHGAATFDAYETRQALQAGAHESDPFLRPFANSPGIYAAIQVAPVVLDYTARRMQRSQYGLFRRTWWLPQSVGAGIYLFSGVHDLHVANAH